MRFSKLLIPTLKETPAEAEVVSHQLLLQHLLFSDVILCYRCCSGTPGALPLLGSLFLLTLNTRLLEMFPAPSLGKDAILLNFLIESL